MLRGQAVAVLPALLGALSWMFNGYVMVWFEWEFTIILAALLPLAMLVIDRALNDGSRATYFCLTLVIALILSSGFFQLIVYTLVILSIYTLYRLLTDTSLITSKILPAFSICLILACVIALPFFIPKLDILLNEVEIQRPRYQFDELFSRVGKLQPSHLLMLFFPNLFSNPAGESVLPFPGQFTYSYNNYNEQCMYVGITTLTLAGTALFYFRKNECPFFCSRCRSHFAYANGHISLLPAV